MTAISAEQTTITGHVLAAEYAAETEVFHDYVNATVDCNVGSETHTLFLTETYMGDPIFPAGSVLKCKRLDPCMGPFPYPN